MDLAVVGGSLSLFSYSAVAAAVAEMAVAVAETAAVAVAATMVAAAADADLTANKRGAVKKVPKKKGCDLAKKQDSSLFLWYN